MNKPLKHSYGVIDKDYGMFLATRPPDEDGPIYMVNLMKYHDVAQYEEGETAAQPLSGREADDQYNPSSVLNKIGATIVFVGDVTSNHVGDEDWDRIAIVRYPTRKSFIDMQSRKDFGEKHVHKAAGMLRTTIVCCRPQDEALDTRERPTPLDLRIVAMIVRQSPNRDEVLGSLPSTVNFSAEGTIIGDGRMWDTVQFVPVETDADVATIASTLTNCAPGESYVMGIRASLDAITTLSITP